MVCSLLSLCPATDIHIFVSVQASDAEEEERGVCRFQEASASPLRRITKPGLMRKPMWPSLPLFSPGFGGMAEKAWPAACIQAHGGRPGRTLSTTVGERRPGFLGWHGDWRHFGGSIVVTELGSQLMSSSSGYFFWCVDHVPLRGQTLARALRARILVGGRSPH